MTNVGKIRESLGPNETSEEVEIAGLKWCLSRNEFFQFCCAPDYDADVLWSCTAKGKLTVWGDCKEEFQVWSASFDYVGLGDAEYACSPNLELPHTSKELYFEANIEVLKFRRIDLSSSTNEAIESRKDAACLEVEGKKLWVSKKILSVHSPFFKTLFSDDFKDKAPRTFPLKEVKFDDFKLFLSVIYNFDITIKDEDYLKELLRLGAMWQCDSVLHFCCLTLGSDFLPLDVKIVLCDRYGFFPALTTIIRSANLLELKEFAKEVYSTPLSHFTHSLIMERLVTCD